MRPAEIGMIPTSQSVSRFHAVIDGLLRVLVVLAALTVVSFGAMERWRLADTLPWQTDELPLLMRFTAACGQVNSEETARTFEPSAFRLRTGTMRALQPPKDRGAALHTTTNFWANLSIYFGGVKPWVARMIPFAFAMGALMVIACATRALGGGVSAVALALGLVALSPLGIIYAAQARGYAEAMFLTPLLLLGIDSLRRHPRSLFRSALVLLVALQLSLTVYTMWLYWVFPILLVATIWLPREIVERDIARQVRFTLGMMVIALVIVMGVYTVDRWSALTFTAAIAFTAAHMGEPLSRLAAFLDFAAEVARELTPLKELATIPAFLGLVIVLRSNRRWWGIAMVGSLLIPCAFALSRGSAGYVRNFAYLAGPIAMLAGLGMERLLIALLERRHRVLVHATAAVLLLAGMLAAWDGAVRDAQAMILPNWGRVVQRLNQRPENVGPRWISPCLTHHWPINWYQGPQSARRIVEAGEEQSIELVVGTTFNQQGAEIVYREDVDTGATVESAAPPFLTRNLAVEKMHGVTVRRWLAKPVVMESNMPSSDGHAFWIRWRDDGANTQSWSAFLKSVDHASFFLGFKPASVEGSLLRALVVDGSHLRVILENLAASYPRGATELRVYELSPMPVYLPYPVASAR